MRREKSILVSLPCVATYLIYDTDLPVFSFSGFHGDPNCQIECDMSVITKNWRYWKMINETNQRNYSGLIKRHTMHLLFLFQVVLFLCLLNWTPGRQRDWILFFFIDSAAVVIEVTITFQSVCLMNYQRAPGTSVFFSLLIFWRQHQTFWKNGQKYFFMTFFWNGAHDAFFVRWHLILQLCSQWRVKWNEKLLYGAPLKLMTCHHCRLQI